MHDGSSWKKFTTCPSQTRRCSPATRERLSKARVARSSRQVLLVVCLSVRASKSYSKPSDSRTKEACSCSTSKGIAKLRKRPATAFMRTSTSDRAPPMMRTLST